MMKLEGSEFVCETIRFIDRGPFNTNTCFRCYLLHKTFPWEYEYRL